jgi:hypothetical protein
MQSKVKSLLETVKVWDYSRVVLGDGQKEEVEDCS